MDFFTAPGSAPFTISILVMLGLTLVELLALAAGASFHDVLDDLLGTHLDTEIGSPAPDMPHVESGAVQPDGFARVLDWLHVGRVPVLMILVVFLTVFGLVGLLGQALLRELLGMAAPAILAIPGALLLSMPLMRTCTGALARVMPREETNAVRPESFVGTRALVTGGNARAGLPAQARLTDEHGTTHYVMVEPAEPQVTLANGSTVLLVRQAQGGRFAAVPHPDKIDSLPQPRSN